MYISLLHLILYYVLLLLCYLLTLNELNVGVNWTDHDCKLECLLKECMCLFNFDLWHLFYIHVYDMLCILNVLYKLYSNKS